MFIVFQGIKSSLQEADSEFPHITSCTDSQVQCRVLEARCHFQWDTEKWRDNTVHWGHFPKVRRLQRQVSWGIFKCCHLQYCASQFPTTPQTGILKALRWELLLNNMQQDEALTSEICRSQPSQQAARAYRERSTSADLWLRLISTESWSLSSIPHHSDAGALIEPGRRKALWNPQGSD